MRCMHKKIGIHMGLQPGWSYREEKSTGELIDRHLGDETFIFQVEHSV